MSAIGSELYYDPTLSRAERWYCRLFGVPIVGLRIRLRRLAPLLPARAERVLDAGCGRGVISRYLARRYPQAAVEAVDNDAELQRRNRIIGERMGLANCRFVTGDLLALDGQRGYDLAVSVDNLEHIADDRQAIANLYAALRPGGLLVVHVPHYYRRWPLLHRTVNFDVPGHERPGYHLAELTERLAAAGFAVERCGFSYGLLENLANNLSYAITGARERNRLLYALLFPLLDAVAWLGQWHRPRWGAGVWALARRPGE